MKTTAAIPLSMYRGLVKNITMLQPHLYDSVFNKFGSGGNDRTTKYRIYIPVGQNKSVVDTPSSTPNPSVLKYLEDNNYKIDNYALGTCIMPDGKRTTKIGKVISSKPDLLKLFVNDPSRRSAKAISGGSLLCVISRHPYDILGISFDRGWSSCTNLADGGSASELRSSVKFGLLAAYLVKDDDKNINKPIARILIRPYFIRGKTHVYLSMDRREYGDANPLFRKTVSKFVDYCNSGSPKGIYSAPREMYLDAEPESIPFKFGIDDIGKLEGIGYDFFITFLKRISDVDMINYMLDKLYKDDEDCLTNMLSGNPNLDEKTLISLYTKYKKEPWLREAIMKNLNATEAVLLLGIKDKNESVCVDAIENPNATEKILLIGANSKSSAVREATMYKTNATEEILLIGVQSRNSDVVTSAVSNDNATEKVLLMGAKNRDIGVRECVMEHPNSTEAVLLIGAKDKNRSVCLAAVENPNATEAVLLISAKDKNEIVCLTAMEHSNATEAVLLIGVQSRYTDVVISAVSNDNATEKVLLIGAKNRDTRLRLAVMEHSNATEAVLLIGVQSRNSDVVYYTVANDNATEKVLLIGAKNRNMGVRERVMKHKNATMKVLTIGVNDPDKNVRKAARKNPNWTDTTKASFISSATKRLESVK